MAGAIMVSGRDPKRRWLAIQGGTCSGKTTLAGALVASLGSESALAISIDVFYKDTDKALLEGLSGRDYPNWDHPDSVDWDGLRGVMGELSEGRAATLPIYDFTRGLRTGTRPAGPASVMIIEGLWPCYDRWVSDKVALSVFLDMPPDVRLARRIMRDVVDGERNWPLRELLEYYFAFSRPADDDILKTLRSTADLVLDGQQPVSAQVSVVREEMRRVGFLL